MNRWKIGFFLLAGLVAAALSAIIFFIGSTPESIPLPDMEVVDASNNVLTVSATKENFESIANTYVRKAMKGEPLPLTIKVDDDVALFSELTVFSFTFPVIMHFDPVVREDGNLILKQSSMEIGQLNIPAFNRLENIEGFSETSSLDDCSSQGGGIVHRPVGNFCFR